MLEPNQKINFDLKSIKGEGIIKGCSATPQPIRGHMYIVKVINFTPTIPNETYAYEYISIPENCIKVIKEN